jgi:hypothetical protein
MNWRVLSQVVVLVQLAYLVTQMCRIPDEEAGEIPAACVVLKPDCFISPAEIQAFVASKVNWLTFNSH